MSLAVKDAAPNFSLPDQNGTTHTLSDYKGKWVLLFFYPKDDTPGCTTEACAFRDGASLWKKLGLTVFGVSVDSVKSHAKFDKKYKLGLTLLADESKEVVGSYGVWAKKKFMGREYMGTLRTSFLIDPKGKIAKIYEKVSPITHAEEIERDVRALIA